MKKILTSIAIITSLAITLNAEYQTKDAYGNYTNSSDDYQTKDAYGNYVNSNDCYQTKDAYGNYVNSCD
jgi:hypothetical protein